MQTAGSFACPVAFLLPALRAMQCIRAGYDNRKARVSLSDREFRNMAIKAHMETLDRRHREIESEIEGEVKKPAGDDLHIGALKREKLRIKDRIAELRQKIF